ncbi:citrate transporter family protein, partial [Vibrio parahaemolyticus V-223/04]
HSPSYVG